MKNRGDQLPLEDMITLGQDYGKIGRISVVFRSLDRRLWSHFWKMVSTCHDRYLSAEYQPKSQFRVKQLHPPPTLSGESKTERGLVSSRNEFKRMILAKNNIGRLVAVF